MKIHYRKTLFADCTSWAVIFLILFTLAPARSFAQSKPAPQKPKPAAAQPARKSSSAGAAKKPAARTAAKPISSSKPAPARQQTPVAPAPAAEAPQKIPTTPVSDYKAHANTPQARKKPKVYGQGFSESDKLLNVGLGLSSRYYGTPFGVSFETGVHPDISVGVQLDYNSGQYNDYYYNSSRWGYKAYYLGVRGSYHFNRLLRINSSKVDLYAGVGLGYQTFRWNDRSYGYGYDYRSGLFFNYYVGGKYYFAPKVAAFVELGYTGLSSSRVGIAFKF